MSIRKQILLLIVLFAANLIHPCVVNSTEVDTTTARMAAKFFLQQRTNYESNELKISLSKIISTPDNQPAIYAFDISDIGFILVAANDEITPILGYSFEGRFEEAYEGYTFHSFLDAYVEDIDAFVSASSLNATQQAEKDKWQSEWKALANGKADCFARKGRKNVNELLTSRWSQGSGYNNYCPVYNNRHAVTGCVATAMAQIIRYHKYPNVGFGSHSYAHTEYGILRAAFDSAYYDYNLMPNQVNQYSDSNIQHAVSLLCYHCGIAVNMNYENPSHTSGSGAYSENVPEALHYFGYTKAYYLAKGSRDDWGQLIQNDLDQGLPVYYSGTSSSGGHAFVCDGYEDDMYHFNFGWGGSSNGYYSLTSVNGFSTGQAAVFNIRPSWIRMSQDRVYASPDGVGSGSSWEDPTSDVNSAIILLGLYNKGQVWLKGGVYVGDTLANYAFTLHSGVSLLGGFEGFEDNQNQRGGSATTILSGRNERGVLYAPTMSQFCYLYDLTLSDGVASTGSALFIANRVLAERLVITQNKATDSLGAAVYIYASSQLRNCLIYNNYCGGVESDNGTFKNCLIAHNDSFGVRGSGGYYINCDIVSNKGIAVSDAGTMTLRNSVVWNNSVNLQDVNNLNRISFSAIEDLPDSLDENSNFGVASINAPSVGNGVFFVDPSIERGRVTTLGDWRLTSRSALINSGDTVTTNTYTPDLARNSRKLDDRIDIGCYEWNVAGIYSAENNVQSLRVFPNPSTGIVNIISTPGYVSLFDIMGRLIRSASYVDEFSTMDLSSLNSGVYILRHENGSVVRIVKQ